MINRPIGLFIALTALTPLSACAGRCEPLKGQSFYEVDAQIARFEHDALAEYFFGRPESSISKLNQLVEVYGATNCTTVVSESARQGYQYEIVLTRARLARQYEKLGQASKAQQETDRALELGRTLVPGGAWSSTDLKALIERVDAGIRSQISPPERR
jgi:hypothetical protein